MAGQDAYVAIGALGRYIDEAEPALSWRIGQGGKNEPLVWLPAPDGWAVWVEYSRRRYRAVISKRVPPKELK